MMIQEGHLEEIQQSQIVRKPSISIIIPVLQEEKLLARTLAIFTQERKQHFDLEIIVSDGGSTDATIDIAHKFADTVIIHDEPRRQTIAEGRNKGAEKARGEIFVFMNADTFPANPDAFLEYVRNWHALTYKPCALACPVSIYPEERIFSDTIFSWILNSYVGFMVNIAGFGMGRGECQIFTRSAFYSAGMYNAAIPAGEDFEIFRRTRKIGGLSFVKHLLVYESPRRFRRYGYPRILLEWAINWFWVLMFGKARSKDWEAVR
jgi:glycosyltransferase involved in cell wall biosynthesis